MPVADERLELIRANAALVVSEMANASGTDLGYGNDGVAWVEGFIERQRGDLSPENLYGLVNVLGCYLGEAIIAAVPGAEWAEDGNGALGILFPNGDMAFPFAKVEKQLVEGVENGESTLSFYNISVSYLATGKLGKGAREEAP